jgi:hypothetical protein
MNTLKLLENIDIVNNVLIFACPHCNLFIEVLLKDVACAIFRHGTFISTGEPINPHASKKICDSLVTRGEIYGCGKPFRVDLIKKLVTMCDYI